MREGMVRQAHHSSDMTCMEILTLFFLLWHLLYLGILGFSLTISAVSFGAFNSFVGVLLVHKAGTQHSTKAVYDFR